MCRGAIAWALSTLALSAFGLGVVPATASAAEDGEISGTVTQASNGNPIRRGGSVVRSTPKSNAARPPPGAVNTLFQFLFGRYLVEFAADFQGLNYITQYWQEAEEFKLVEIKEGGETVSKIDAAMNVGGGVLRHGDKRTR